jgi:uncharacterized Zn finger protein
MTANYKEIYVICPNCKGDEITIQNVLDPLTGEKTEQTYEIECPDCKGLGKILWGYLKT